MQCKSKEKAMTSNSKYVSFFTLNQIQSMSTSDLYAQITRFKSMIERLTGQGEDPYRYECELCYFENEAIRRERSKNKKSLR
jgi:hypothetical protein